MTEYGKTTPRVWTKPLRELTPETSRGFEVIKFARLILNIRLYPWQEWLLTHALETLPDGSYRFRRVFVLVARQNGKTLLASVLAAWWLFVDSQRHPDKVPPVKFKVVGVAQTLDIAAEPWNQVRTWCDPDPDTAEEAELAFPALQEATAYASTAHGKEHVMTRHRAHYEIRAAKNARGKPAARAIMDELREQHTWDGWDAISQTSKSFWSNQKWGISNAGSPRSVVLKTQRDNCLEMLKGWDEQVTAGGMTPSEYAAAGGDVSVALFEWSAEPDCAKDDRQEILQANPSIGYSALTVDQCISDSKQMTDAGYRTEVLCQWVSSRVESYIDVRDWDAGTVDVLDVRIAPGTRTVWGVEISDDRKFGWLASAVHDVDGNPVVQVLERRIGMMWIVDHLKRLAAESGFYEVAVKSKGCAAMELVQPLEDAGLIVHPIDGSTIGLATGRFRDRVREGKLKHPDQPLVRLAVEGAVTRRFAENEGWDPVKSVPDIAGLVAESTALYALEVLDGTGGAASAYQEFDLLTF